MLKQFFAISPLALSRRHSVSVDSSNQQIWPDVGGIHSLSRNNNPVIGILGTKGGVGSTTVALNLTFSLSKKCSSATLLDLNFQQPDLAILLGKEPRYSLFDLLGSGDGIDRHLFDACCMDVSVSGNQVNLISPPLTGESFVQANLSQVSGCLDTMRLFSDIWILDLPKHLDASLVTLFDRCHRIMLIFESTIPGVAACRRWLNICRELGYSEEKIVCVLNRSGSKKSAIDRQLGKEFDGRPILRIPNAYHQAWDCSTNGSAIVLAHPRHSYAKAIEELAAFIFAP